MASKEYNNKKNKWLDKKGNKRTGKINDLFGNKLDIKENKYGCIPLKYDKAQKAKSPWT